MSESHLTKAQALARQRDRDYVQQLRYNRDQESETKVSVRTGQIKVSTKSKSTFARVRQQLYLIPDQTCSRPLQRVQAPRSPLGDHRLVQDIETEEWVEPHWFLGVSLDQMGTNSQEARDIRLISKVLSGIQFNDQQDTHCKAQDNVKVNGSFGQEIAKFTPGNILKTRPAIPRWMTERHFFMEADSKMLRGIGYQLVDGGSFVFVTHIKFQCKKQRYHHPVPIGTYETTFQGEVVQPVEAKSPLRKFEWTCPENEQVCLPEKVETEKQVEVDHPDNGKLKEVQHILRTHLYNEKELNVQAVWLSEASHEALFLTYSARSQEVEDWCIRQFNTMFRFSGMDELGKVLSHIGLID